MTWTYDVHGRVVSHKDLGGKNYSYTYQANGQLSVETNGWGLNRMVTYYANGLVKRIKYSANEYTEYQYDAAGNRTYERNYHKDTSLGIDIDTITRVSYDSHNRVSRVTTDDMANGGIRTLDIEYGYDAVGNRRRVVAYSGYGPGVAPIAVANEAPISHANPPAVNLRHGEPVEWRWHPGDYFNDPEGAELSFTVTQGASGALPSWLSYRRDEATGEWVFSYNGAGTVGQTASIRIKATDPDGAVATATFSANVVSANTKPSLVGASKTG